jgi:hypothetical protein
MKCLGGVPGPGKFRRTQVNKEMEKKLKLLLFE